MDRGIKVPPEEAKTRLSGTISNNESGPAQLDGLFPQVSHHDTELRTLFLSGTGRIYKDSNKH